MKQMQGFSLKARHKNKLTSCEDDFQLPTWFDDLGPGKFLS